MQAQGRKLQLLWIHDYNGRVMARRRFVLKPFSLAIDNDAISFSSFSTFSEP